MTNPTWTHVKFWIQDKISIDVNNCWNWTANKTSAGYGKLWGDMAHRLSYQAYTGPIGKGLDIDHLCRNRGCVNPEHLEPVTRKENLSRGIGISLQKKAAAAKASCKNGHLLTSENTYIRPSDGIRQCRKCKSASTARYQQANRDKINTRKRAWRKQWREKGIRK